MNTTQNNHNPNERKSEVRTIEMTEAALNTVLDEFNYVRNLKDESGRRGFYYRGKDEVSAEMTLNYFNPKAGCWVVTLNQYAMQIVVFALSAK